MNDEVYNIDYDSPEIPASVKELKPKIFSDGTQWFVSSGDDIATGISGSGSTLEKAMQDFDSKYAKIKENSV